MFIGRLIDTGIGVESSRGVAVAATFWLPKVAFSFQERADMAISEAEYGVINGYGADGYVVSHYGEGDMETELTARSIGVLLYAVFGSLSTSGPVDSAYTHSFSLSSSNQHKSLSIHVNDQVADKVFPLAMIDKLTISVKRDEIVRAAVTFKSQKAKDDVSTPTYTTVDYKFTHKHFTLKVASATSGLAAASELRVKEFSLTFEKNAEYDYVLGTVQPKDVVNKKFTVKGDFVLNYENETQKNYNLNGTTRALRMDLTSDQLIGVSAVSSLTIDLSKVLFNSWEKDMALDDLVTEKVSFIALFDQGGNNNVVNQCTLVNNVASY